MIFTPVTILFLAMIFVALLDRLQQRFHLFALLALPSTMLHELSHFLVALLTLGKPVGFSLLPRRHAHGYLLGQVLVSNPTWFNSGAIALAPLFLVPLALLVLRYLLPLRATPGTGLAMAYLLASMIYGCFPSQTDWRVARQAPLGLLAALALLSCAVYVVLAGRSRMPWLASLEVAAGKRLVVMGTYLSASGPSQVTRGFIT